MVKENLSDNLSLDRETVPETEYCKKDVITPTRICLKKIQKTLFNNSITGE
jgi:hypothetical protein